MVKDDNRNAPRPKNPDAFFFGIYDKTTIF